MVHEIVLRRAKAQDERALRELRLYALTDAPEQFGESLRAVQARSDEQWCTLLASVLPPNSQAAFIAELDGVPVGSVYALHDPLDRTIGRLGGMWVAPAARRLGIASALFRECRAWAQELGKNRIRLWVAEDATAARRLYESLGFLPIGATKAFPGDPTRELLEMEVIVS